MSDSKHLARWIGLAKILVLIGIVYWLISSFPKDKWDVLVEQKKDWWLIVQAMIVVLLAVILSFWRWLVLVQAIGVPMRLTEAIRLGFLGNLLNQVSVGSLGGDVFKAIEAARRSEGKRTEVVASVLVDRAMGLLGLLIVSAIVLVGIDSLSTVMNTIRWSAVLFSIIGVSGLTTIVVFGRKMPTGFLMRIPGIGRQLFRFVQACMSFQGRPRLLIEMLLISVGVHVLLTLSCVMISHSLYSTPPSIQQHFMAIPPAVAAATLPITPGGLGVQEAAIESLFKELPGVPAEFSPLIMAIFFRGLLFSSTLIGALYYFVGIGSTRTGSETKNLRESAP